MSNINANNQKGNLLIVDDIPENLHYLSTELSRAGYHVRGVISGAMALIAAQEAPPDLILLDIKMPEMDGYEVCQHLKAIPVTQSIPVMFISVLEDSLDKVKAFKAGAVDYVTKPIYVEELLVRIDHQLKLQKAHQQITALNETLEQRVLIRTQALQRSTQRLSGLNTIAQTALLEGDVTTTAKAALLHLRQYLNCNWGAIVQFDWQRHMGLVLCAQPQNKSPDFSSSKTIPLEEFGFAQYEIPSVDLLFIDDIASFLNDVETSKPSPSKLKSLLNLGFQSVIIVPLLVEKDILGEAILAHQDLQGFDQKDTEAIQEVANYLALSLHRVSLYKKAQFELSERERIEAKLHHDALHDGLTNLPNRPLFMDRLQQAMLLAGYRNRHLPKLIYRGYAVLFLDLDRFKLINDSLGHSLGDQLILMIAQRLKICLRPGDTLARFGGDEFAVLLENLEDVSDVLEITSLIHQSLTQAIQIDGHHFFVSTSIGIAYGMDTYSDPEMIIRDAETAMYRAKRNCRGSYEIFDESMYAQVSKILKIENDLRQAIERHEFKVFYQPVVDLHTHKTHSFEALVRWQHPEYGLIPPDEFIPVAEDVGLITDIDLWVMEQACQQLKIWRQQAAEYRSLTISVNLSGKDFARPNLTQAIDTILKQHQLPGDALIIEITETSLIENIACAKDVVDKLTQQLGIVLSLDDFGTGYSSLSYLHKFSVSKLKIDRSFITALDAIANDNNIVKSIVSLGKSLGMQVIAEGIEEVSQVHQLKEYGCDFGQGYLYAKPLTATLATAFLAR